MIKFKLLSHDKTWTLGTVEAEDRQAALTIARTVFGSGIRLAQIQAT